MTAKTSAFGRASFEAYNVARGGRTYDDKPIPGWDEIPQGIRDGWAAAVEAAHAEVLDHARHTWQMDTMENVPGASLREARRDESEWAEQLTKAFGASGRKAWIAAYAAWDQ